MAGRRKRVDSAAGAVEIMAAASSDLSPPKHLKLRRGDRPFWDAVIEERARVEWSASDLAVAANLARAMADAELIASMAVKAGGYVDPELVIAAIASSDKLARRIVTLRRALGLDSRSQHGEQRDVNRRREAAKGIEAAAAAADDDDLIASPTVQ